MKSRRCGWLGLFILVLASTFAFERHGRATQAVPENHSNPTDFSYMASTFAETMTGVVTQVNAREQSFAIGVSGKQYIFSATKLASALPGVGDLIEVTYTQMRGGPREAASIKPWNPEQGDEDARIFCRDNTDTPKCCKRNGGYWVSLGAGDPGGCNFYGYWYRITRVDVKNKTFTVIAGDKTVTFNAIRLKGPFPRVGEDIDITYTKSPGGPMQATNLNTSRSNIY